MKRNGLRILETSNKGFGVFANRNFFIGEVVVYGKAIEILEGRTNHSFQIDDNTHVQLDKISRTINHSCEPNTGVRNNAFQAYDFIALRSIKRGEEITWDYETTEYISIAVENCLCCSKNCRKLLRGFKYRANELIKTYGIYIADYLKLRLFSRRVIANVTLSMYD
jgi:uncharacterized protein